MVCNHLRAWEHQLVSCAKTAEPINTSKSDDASPDSTLQGSLEKKPLQAATFPNRFEALVLEVCDETKIAELKVKVGGFEMHIKRNIGATTVPLSNISPTTPPPIPSKPMDSAPGTLPPSPPKSSPEKKNPFIDASREKSPRLTALEASGTGTYVLVPSPMVGFFRRGRTVKGKRQPPICKEGDLVQEGQVIGYSDQFGSGIPVKTDVAGQVLKLLVEDGGNQSGAFDIVCQRPGSLLVMETPLIAVLPSFHDINLERLKINESFCYVAWCCVVWRLWWQNEKLK
ncbi:hypothetical protein VNO80_04875 [Phaseolus coccineus]|uniref:Lipoyl-binding domain-containing protein n=1 Tax=Phaseolus coccineus TaxID=3886 RepID=A0AAN9RK13_PHACN